MDRTALNRRFHALLNQMGIMDRKEDILCGYGVQSSKELTDDQLRELVDRLADEQRLRSEAALREARSAVLRLLTDLGVYYTLPGEHKQDCWDRVNRFVSSPKLAGDIFYRLGVPELKALGRKLRSMKDHGYYYRQQGQAPTPPAVQIRDRAEPEKPRPNPVQVFVNLTGDSGPVN